MLAKGDVDNRPVATEDLIDNREINLHRQANGDLVAQSPRAAFCSMSARLDSSRIAA
jgi:hypothetical protein